MYSLWFCLNKGLPCDTAGLGLGRSNSHLMVALGYVTHKKRVRHSFTLFKHNYAIKRKEPFLHRKAHILPFHDLTKTPNTPEYTHPPSLIFVLLFLFLFFPFTTPRHFCSLARVCRVYSARVSVRSRLLNIFPSFSPGN